MRALVRQAGQATVLEAGGPALGVLAPGLVGGTAGDHDRGQVLDAFTTMAERLARDRMLWLVFEDVHWADASSRELIDYLVRAVAPCQLLAICTRRTHDEPPTPQLVSFVSELVRHPRGERLTLDRLTTAQVTEQVADILDRAPEPALVERVAARSQGVPFLTEELLGAGGDGSGDVGELMLARVGTLGEDAQLVVQAAAIGDGHQQHSMLSRVCGLPEPDFASAVAATIGASVLEQDASGDGYAFRHALLREAVDDALLPAQRRHWHRRWAEELEADPGRMVPGMAQIAAAQHWYHTDDVVRAFDAARQAELAAWALRASPEQARLSLRVIELLPRVPHTALPPDLRMDYAWTAAGALLQSGAWADGLAFAEDELGQADAASNPVWRIHLQLVRRTCADNLGRSLPEPLDVDADVAAVLAAPPDNNLVTATLLWYRDILFHRGQVVLADRLLSARPLVDAVIGLARRARLTVGAEQPGTASALPLTARELDVLRLLAEGHSNGQIAKTLFISPKTASVHVSHILTKLDVATRTAAAALAHRHGLLDDPAR